jgi:hypothetical protein
MKAYINQNTSYRFAIGRQLELFQSGPMHNEAHRPKANDVEQTDEAKEQLHIDSRF